MITVDLPFRTLLLVVATLRIDEDVGKDEENTDRGHVLDATEGEWYPIVRILGSVFKPEL